MNTLKYFSKTLLAYFTTILLLGFTGIVIFLIGTYQILTKEVQNQQDPTSLVQQLIKDDQLNLSSQNKHLLEDRNIWLMVLTEKGEIEESFQLPKQLDHPYKLTDIVRFNRWYLEDYPVFTFVMGENILVLGYPKGTYDKFPANYYNVNLFIDTFKWILAVFVGLIIASFFVYFWTQMKLRKEFNPITQALVDLSENKPILLDEKGNLTEITSALNQTSHLLLKTKEMRNHWIRGISHDLRNPLTLILGNTAQLEALYGPSKQVQQIQANIHQMEHIISNLNMSYLLDNPALQQEMEHLDLNKLLRQIIADFYNNYEELHLDFQLPEQPSFILGNSSLLTRAITNLLLNSLTHNENPHQQLMLMKEGDNVLLTISDNGNIRPEKVLELNQKTRHYDTHGMGTIITKQIIALHQGTIQFTHLNPGLQLTIALPISFDKV
ncbi:sensor histidine kinase [Streptococcus merionis]|uniref:sensor histidine kinase n=1 Tax=Streptococcus merionis TaxID=400065 RepID=UPI003516C30C